MNAPAARRAHSSTRRKLVWWCDAIIINTYCLLMAAGAFTVHDGLRLEVFIPLGWAFAFTVLKVGARLDFRRGWRHGYESATHALVQRASGTTPDVSVRATVHGDPTPEPWDPHTPIDVRQSGAR